VVCPGLIDLSARLERTGFRVQGDARVGNAGRGRGWHHEPKHAARHDPPLDEPGLVEMLKHRARSLNSRPRVSGRRAHLEARRERLTEMVVLRDAGCVAFSHADTRFPDTQVLWARCNTRAPSASPCGCDRRTGTSRAGGVAHGTAEVATRLGLAGIPAFAETIALATHTAAGAHHAHGACTCAVCPPPKASRWCALPRKRGCPSAADISAHHAHLSDIDLGYFDSHCHVIPPFRSLRDRDALRSGLADGTNRCAVLGSRAGG